MAKALTKGKLREPAFSQALNRQKIYSMDQDPESQADRQTVGRL